MSSENNQSVQANPVAELLDVMHATNTTDSTRALGAGMDQEYVAEVITNSQITLQKAGYQATNSGKFDELTQIGLADYLLANQGELGLSEEQKLAAGAFIYKAESKGQIDLGECTLTTEYARVECPDRAPTR